MALKGQRFNKYSEEEKQKIIEKYHSGVSSAFLSKEYNIPMGTIKTLSRKCRNTGSLKNDIYHNRGRQKKSDIDYKRKISKKKNTRPSSRHNEREGNIHKSL